MKEIPMIFNGDYEDCNNPKSILHILIPRKDDGFNDQCKMFVEAR